MVIMMCEFADEYHAVMTKYEADSAVPADPPQSE
jgi:hypothetical protein